MTPAYAVENLTIYVTMCLFWWKLNFLAVRIDENAQIYLLLTGVHFRKLKMFITNLYIQQAEEQGLDYDRIKALNMPADVAEKLELKRKRKKNPDQGFSCKFFFLIKFQY